MLEDLQCSGNHMITAVHLLNNVTVTLIVGYAAKEKRKLGVMRVKFTLFLRRLLLALFHAKVNHSGITLMLGEPSLENGNCYPIIIYKVL